MKNSNLFILALLLIWSNVIIAQSKSDDILGVYLNPNGNSKIKIYKVDNQYLGKIIWLKEPLDKNGNAKKDVENSNKELRNRLVIGLVTLTDLQFIDDDWTDGKMYSPERGKSIGFEVVSITKESMKIKISFGFISKELELKRIE